MMTDATTNSRLEAFCDGVFSIALTLLIINIQIPPSVSITNDAEFWVAIRNILPSIFAFVLSFGIILITWVNHHATLRLVNKISYPFIYANGFFLLTVVFLPFPTSLLGEHIWTDHASPAVVLYCAACALQAIAWNLLTRAALKPKDLTKNSISAATIRRNHVFSYYAFVLYMVCSIAALWIPQIVAGAITAIWSVWLIVGLKMKDE